MSEGVSYYDLESARSSLQEQIWDLDRKLDRAIDDLRQADRDGFRDVRDGLAGLHDRLTRLENGS